MLYLEKYDLPKYTDPDQNKFPVRLIAVMNGVFKAGNSGLPKLPTREHSEDMSVLRDILKQLGMIKYSRSVLTLHQDRSEVEIHDLFQAESQRKELHDCGMLVVVIMSHGYTGHIYDCNGREVEVDKLMEYFRGMKCPALVGKPKVFIIQACEEDYYQERKGGAVVADAGGFAETKACCMPSEADFLILWSPIPAKVWWRDQKKEGALFFAKLREVFADEDKVYEGMEIRKLMTRVIQMVCEELESKDLEHFEASGYRLPYMVDMLTKELYFHTAKSVTAS